MRDPEIVRAIAAYLLMRNASEFEGVPATDIVEHFKPNASESTVRRILKTPGFVQAQQPRWPFSYYYDPTAATVEIARRAEQTVVASLPDEAQPVAKSVVKSSLPKTVHTFFGDVEIKSNRHAFTSTEDAIEKFIPVINTLVEATETFVASKDAETRLTLFLKLRALYDALVYATEVVENDPRITTEQAKELFGKVD